MELNRGATITASLLRIGIGIVYLWGFLSQAFGIAYSNTDSAPDDPNPSYGWHFEVDGDAGWISSGFSTSPTEGYVDAAHGPTAPIPQNLPVGLVDFVWIFAIGGLGFALTFGFCMRIAGIGGAILNVLIWFAGFPPSNNPLIDAEHMMFAVSLLLLMFLRADEHWGIGRWWRAHTPDLLH